MILVMKLVWNDSKKNIIDTKRKEWRAANEGKDDSLMPDDIRPSTRGLAAACTFGSNAGKHERDKKKQIKQELMNQASASPPSPSDLPLTPTLPAHSSSSSSSSSWPSSIPPIPALPAFETNEIEDDEDDGTIHISVHHSSIRRLIAHLEHFDH